jgi:hypothetical protein
MFTGSILLTNCCKDLSSLSSSSWLSSLLNSSSSSLSSSSSGKCGAGYCSSHVGARVAAGTSSLNSSSSLLYPSSSLYSSSSSSSSTCVIAGSSASCDSPTDAVASGVTDQVDREGPHTGDVKTMLPNSIKVKSVRGTLSSFGKGLKSNMTAAVSP